MVDCCLVAGLVLLENSDNGSLPASVLIVAWGLWLLGNRNLLVGSGLVFFSENSDNGSLPASVLIVAWEL